ncbi:hypothetical protein F5Y17DRAFT_476562 [Xylariaceae sp. FL0594]|nr:hypothetical protein F5Y17DRAFT_476562 [Xylariaceae sp. FL0594]
MCFSEFIAYTCGHTSVAVNRPCPMTTYLYNNPCCANPATRPLLAETVCYPCSRILHSRGVNITEYEHRFMHERGACQCEIQFPALLHPRLIHRSSIDSLANASSSGSGSGLSENNTVTTTSGSGTLSLYHGSNDPSHHVQHQYGGHDQQQGHSVASVSSNGNTGKTKGKGRHRWKGKGRGGKGKGKPHQDITHHHGPGPTQYQQMAVQETGAGTADIPLFEERQVGEDVEVAVRLSSMYAAEWTKDHAKLHRSGTCKCPVSFEPYKPLPAEDSTENHPNSPAPVEGEAEAACQYGPKSKKAATSVPIAVQEHAKPRRSAGAQAALAPIVHSSPADAYAYAQNNPQYAQAQQTGPSQSRNDGGFASASGSTSARPLASGRGAYNTTHQNQKVNDYGSENRKPVLPPGAVARHAFMKAQMSPLDELLGVVSKGLAAPSQKTDENLKRNAAESDNRGGGLSRPVDVQSVHFHLREDTVRIVGKPIEITPASITGSTGGTQNNTADYKKMKPGETLSDTLDSCVEYHPPEKVIAGFPLGAGPEGESHAGDFEDCDLNLRKREREQDQEQKQQRRVSNEF